MGVDAMKNTPLIYARIHGCIAELMQPVYRRMHVAACLPRLYDRIRLFGALRHINTIMAICANGVCKRDATVIIDVNQTCNIPSHFNSALGFCNEVDYSHQQKHMD